MVIELGDQHMGQQTRAGHASVNRAAGCRDLHHLFTPAARFLQAGDLNDLHLRRDHVEDLHRLAGITRETDHAREASELVASAARVAGRGGEVVGQVVETMKGINASSREISDIIAIIDSIAFQTNILALNAAVEAARAGEQGRGFAVVATEVRELAGRSAQAARQIKTLISASVERVVHGSSQVDEAGATMNELVKSMLEACELVEQISQASQQQALGVAQMGEAVTNMDQVTQQNAAMVEQIAAAAASLRDQADELVGTVAVFQLQT
jgi:methyl-accepting chemotaxis protein